MKDNGIKKGTTDIWFASFLMLHGHDLKDYEVIQKGRGRYFFELDDSTWKKMKMQCKESDINKIKLHQIELKDLVY